jgi:hypothetical protein
MAVKFKPTGFLNIAADPSVLPSTSDGKNEASGEMTRCTNLHLDTPGAAVTRFGSSKVNSSAIDQLVPHLLLEMAGDRYAFAGTKIYKNEASIATGLTSARWSAIEYSAYNVTTQSIFAANGTDRKRITGSTVSEWGIAAPTAAPTLNSGDLTGYAYTYDWEGTYHATANSYQIGTTRSNYQCLFDWEQNIAIASAATYAFTFFFEGQSSYSDKTRIGVKYTYCRKTGATLECESNPGTAAYVEGVAGLKVAWAASSDSQVTHVRIYRTLAGGATFYYAGEYAVGSSPAMVQTQDSALGTSVATDHDRPPLGAVVAGPTYNGYCFMLKDNLLYYCKPNQPEYWPSTYYIEVGPPQEPLTAIQIHNGVPFAMSTEEIYMVQGTGADSFFPFPMRAKAGALSHIGALSVAGLGIAHADIDGLYGFAGAGEDGRIADDRFRPLFSGTTTGSIPGLSRTNAANCWLLVYDNKLWFGYPAAGSTYPDNMIVIDLQTQRGRHYQYAQQFGAVCVDGTNNRILALDSTGYVRRLDDSSVTTDDGTAISWQIESKAFTDQLYKYFPRYAKYDITIGSGATATGNILLNDTIIQTHSLTASRQTKKRLIDGNNGDRLGVRITGTGSVTFRECEIE